jgi:hypothetical protein
VDRQPEADGGDEARQPQLAADQEPRRRQPEGVDRERVPAELRDRLQGVGQSGGRARLLVEHGCHFVVELLQRRPPPAHQEQEREEGDRAEQQRGEAEDRARLAAPEAP